MNQKSALNGYTVNSLKVCAKMCLCTRLLVVYLPVTLLSCMCMNVHKPFDTIESFYCFYLSTGDISSGLDTQFKMTGSLTGYEEICSCLSTLIPALTGRQRELRQPHLDERSRVQTTGVVPCSRTLPV